MNLLRIHYRQFAFIATLATQRKLVKNTVRLYQTLLIIMISDTVIIVSMPCLLIKTVLMSLSQAAEIANTTGDLAASYHLARQHENEVSEAINLRDLTIFQSERFDTHCNCYLMPICRVKYAKRYIFIPELKVIAMPSDQPR